MAQKHLFGCRGGEGLVYVFLDLGFRARYNDVGKTLSPFQPSFHSEIRILPGNAVMVAIDMYGKSPLWQWAYGIT